MPYRAPQNGEEAAYASFAMIDGNDAPMANAAGASVPTAQRIWRAHGLQLTASGSSTARGNEVEDRRSLMAHLKGRAFTLARLRLPSRVVPTV